MKDPNKIVTISEVDFVELTTDVAAELSSHLLDPTVPLVLALFTARVMTKLFENADKIDIEENK